MIGKYGVRGGVIVQVKEVSSIGITVVYADGHTASALQSNVKEIADYSSSATLVTTGLDNSVKTAERTIVNFERNLTEIFDGAFLEMMAACLTSDTTPTYRHEELKDMVTASQERRLSQMFAACKEYDVQQLVGILEQCDFYDKFLEWAIQERLVAYRQAGREKGWLKASATGQTGEELQTTNRRVAEQESLAKNAAHDMSCLKKTKDHMGKVREAVACLEEQYLRLYKKTAAVSTQYGTVREKLVSGETVESNLSSVRSLADDWCRNLLKPATVQCVTDAQSARNELQRRRNPKPPDIKTRNNSQPDVTDQSSRTEDEAKPPENDTGRKSIAKNTPVAESPTAAEKKPVDKKDRKDLCFIATAVYGSCDHPDVVSLRQFRDETLQKHVWGRQFITWYYQNGPAYAEWITRRPFLGWCVRVLLRGFVLLLRYGRVTKEVDVILKKLSEMGFLTGMTIKPFKETRTVGSEGELTLEQIATGTPPAPSGKKDKNKKK